MNYPSLTKVGKYISEDEYLAQRLEVGEWASNIEIRNAIQTINFYDLMPLHIEVCATYKCNFSCYWCNCRNSFENIGRVDMSEEQLYHIINILSRKKIGIQWTGGEPLCNPHMVRAVKYASSKGVSQCLFTNGSLLTEEKSKELLKTNLRFIRISLNSSNPEIHAKFHGLNSTELSNMVINNLQTIADIKSSSVSMVQIGLSLVLDSNNIIDAENTFSFIIKLLSKFPNSINFIVIRQTNDYRTPQSYKNNDFNELYKRIMTSEQLARLDKLGCKVKVIDENPLEQGELDAFQGCLGGHLFSEISPSGDMFFCSERYGDQNFLIGNIFKTDLDEIWKSEMRRRVWQETSKKCAKNCPGNSRGAYFNSIFRQIIELVSDEKLDVVLDWIDSINRYGIKCGHTFFI